MYNLDRKRFYSMRPTILCVDDDDFVRKMLVGYLEKEMFQTLEARNGEELKEIVNTQNIDLILLDLVLPDGDGIAFMQQIRAIKEDIPIIILSAKNEEVDRIVGIETGADDYISKPFSSRELKARINAVLRRSSKEIEAPVQEAQSEKISFDGWVLDPRQYQVFDQQGKSADFTTSEFLVLYHLSSSPNQVFSRDHLFDLTRQINSDSYDRAVDVQITRIRKKIGDTAKNPKYIKTIRGVGYLFCWNSI